MKLTKSNIKKVLDNNFREHIDIDFVGIKKSSDGFEILSKPQGINAYVYNSDIWEQELITHIKWQLHL